MAYSIAANSRLAGSTKGNFLDDLTNRMSFPTSTSSRCYNTYPRILAGVGQWPKTQAIKRITRIAVFSGGIVDSLRITYQVENVPAPITVQHGGPGGTEALNFEIGSDEKLVAVYGTRLVNAGPYGDKKYVTRVYLHHLFRCMPYRFITKIVTAGSGSSSDPTEKFDLSWPLTAASSYTFQPPGAPVSYLQAIGFSKVLGEAGSPLI
ncbi:hypothetical protein EDB89DRAFT_1964991 [Lactarius sanguifluus]|nr:hypothetical protein EDB89DRAFT_1964991 [Lactarius sanguifluus]